jgi:acyl-CoA thioesterase-1
MAQRGGFSTRQQTAPGAGAAVDLAPMTAQCTRMHRYLASVAVCAALLLAVPAAARMPEVLAFGDSLTAGLGLPADEAFPALLEARLHADGLAVRVINAGVSGDTTAGGLARLDWALAARPDLVLLALGANDALRGTDPATVRANLDKMIGRIQATGAKVLLIGMLAPSNWGTDYARNFDRIYPELAKAHDVPLYPFFLEGVAMDPHLNQPDGLHPNARGVAVIVDRIAPLVARLLATSAGAKS